MLSDSLRRGWPCRHTTRPSGSEWAFARLWVPMTGRGSLPQSVRGAQLAGPIFPVHGQQGVFQWMPIRANRVFVAGN